MTSEFAVATADTSSDGTTMTETSTTTSESTSTDSSMTETGAVAQTVTATDARATTVESAETMTEPAEECISVVNTAVSTATLSTLTAAVTTAELVDALGADFVGTVFAPTDDAFEALFTALDMTAEEVLADLELLSSVLSLHVVPDVAAMAADLTDGQELITLGGETVTVGVSDGVVTVTSPGGQVATVVAPDIVACDAVVHVIDQVLTPAP